jgi:CheY-like chemotaxis protein
VAEAKGTVLVVDDDDDVREALSSILNDEGYPTTGARDGQEALDTLRSQSLPSLILLDWNMPGMNGPQFMVEVAKDPALARVPVVLVTADARVPAKATSAPFVGYLAKPIALDALFALVGRYCDAAP